MRRSWVGSNGGLPALKKGHLFRRYTITPSICLDTALLKAPQRSVAPLFAMQQPIQPEPSYHHQLPRIRVNAFIAGFGHDEGVAEENAEIAVRRDRVRLGHEHHSGPEYAFERRR